MRNYVLSALIVLFTLSGCHTSTSFILPPNTDLMINGERIALDSKDETGHVTFKKRPFFWTSVAGIEYMLLQEDKVIKKDKLPSSFRVVSVFWPPYAYIYWPVGFRFKCYDLSNPDKKFIEKCMTPEELEKRNASVSSQTVQ